MTVILVTSAEDIFLIAITSVLTFLKASFESVITGHHRKKGGGGGEENGIPKKYKGKRVAKLHLQRIFLLKAWKIQLAYKI